ncbi:uncharacterized protein DNG_03834 [Cephalotrichum gorgonifer]|uniref:Uncharacterized protein n=1 Tax=Cephalotrichum gorgonifer TaxID=2041049 RepID=A0AAE8MVG3_9PEZI|nr:uncharacterized protein DNG_03834 [Cephalotrichum gorgonifer]
MSSGLAISDFFNVNWEELEVAPEDLDFSLGNDGFYPALNFDDGAPAAKLPSLVTDPAARAESGSGSGREAEAETTGTQDKKSDFFAADVPDFVPVFDIFPQAQVERVGIPGQVYPKSPANNANANTGQATSRASSSHKVGEIAFDSALGIVDEASADSTFTDLLNELFKENTANRGPRQDVSKEKVSNTKGPSASLPNTTTQPQSKQDIGAGLDPRLLTQPRNPTYAVIQGSITQPPLARGKTQPQFGPDLAAIYGSSLREQPLNPVDAVAQGTTIQALPPSANTQPQFGPDLATTFGSYLFEQPFNPTNFIDQGSGQTSSTLPTGATASLPQFGFKPIADLDSSLLNQPFNLTEAMLQGSTETHSAMPAHATPQPQYDPNSAVNFGAGSFLNLPTNPTGVLTQGLAVDPRLVIPYGMPMVQPAPKDLGLINPGILAQWGTSQPANPAAKAQAQPMTTARNRGVGEKTLPLQMDPGLVEPATLAPRGTLRLVNPQTAARTNPTIEAVNQALAKTPWPPQVRRLAPATPGWMPANPTAPAAPTAGPTAAAPWHPTPAPVAPFPCRSAGYAQTVGPNPERRRKMLVHKRGRRKVNASDVYLPLDSIPESWGPPQRPKLFSYTEDGEWDPYLHLDKIDILWYITNARRLAKRPLTIWIQNLPPQHNYRYPHDLSSKCRWSECPAGNNSILKGFYRVAFDERPHQSGSTTDPFHNAGYMHLHCFEKIFDAFELVNYGLLTIDDRVFPYEDRNPMAVVKDDDLELAKTFTSWREEQQILYEEFEKARKVGNVMGRIIPREQKLWYVLTKRALEIEGRGRAKARLDRWGNSFDKHVGDLDKHMMLGVRSRARNKATKKRVAAEIADDDESSDEEEEGLIIKRPRGGGDAGNRQPTPALSHITVDSSEDESPARRGARQVHAPAADSPGGAEWLNRRKRKQTATEQEDGEYVDAGFKMPWDADLRGTRRSSFRPREKVRRCASL